jgi:hypothetical protein
VLLLQEVLSSMIVPKGYTALPEDLLPQRHQGHRRTVTLVAAKHTEAVESASFLLPELLGDVAQVRLAPPGGTGPTGRSTWVIGN